MHGRVAIILPKHGNWTSPTELEDYIDKVMAPYKMGKTKKYKKYFSKDELAYVKEESGVDLTDVATTIKAIKQSYGEEVQKDDKGYYSISLFDHGHWDGHGVDSDPVSVSELIQKKEYIAYGIIAPDGKWLPESIEDEEAASKQFATWDKDYWQILSSYSDHQVIMVPTHH